MRALILIVFLLFSTTFFCQGFRTKYFSVGSSDNVARDVFEVSPGNYIAAGFSTDTSEGVVRTQLLLMGIGAQGQIQWTKKHNGGNIEYQNNELVTRCFYKQGNFVYYAGCAHDSDGASPRQFGVFLKFDLNGDTLWRRVFRSADSLEDIVPQMLTASVDGGFLITGFFQHWGNNVNPCLIIKTNSLGVELWRKRINKSSPNVCDGKAIIQDSSSKKIVIIGYQLIGPSSSPYEHILVLDSLGVKNYQGKFYSSSGGGAYDLVQTKDKNFVVVGRKSYSINQQTPGAEKAFAIKFDINFPASQIWVNDSAAVINNYDLYAAACGLKNGDIILGGGVFPLYESDGITFSQAGLVQRFTLIDSQGKTKFEKRYSYYPAQEGLQYYQSLTSFNICSDGGFVAAISSKRYPGVNPFFVVKYDSTGCDSTVVYCAMINSGILESSLQEARFNIFPNPAQNVISVFNNSDFVENAELILLDINGRELKKTILLNENSIPVADLSPGLYFLKIQQNGHLVYTTKLVKE